jgi:hypothetical protein
MQGTSFQVQDYRDLSPRKELHERQQMAIVGDLMAPHLI